MLPRSGSRTRPRRSRRRRGLQALLLVCAAALVPMTAAPSASAAPPDVVNPGLENVTGGVPDCFSRSGWGDHAVTWAIVGDAHTGAAAASVTVSGYASGDRKLLISENDACAPAVTPGETYTVGAWYTSTSGANSITVFRHSAAGWTYWTDLGSLPAAADWTEGTATTPEVPAGTDQITFGISLHGNGTLVTDDYVFDPASTGGPPEELTVNGGLEAGGTPPSGWALSGWGDGTATGTVTSAAHTGNRAYSLTLTGRTVGDHKLLPTQAASPPVQPGATYRLSVWYKSTSASTNITVFAHTASGWQYWTDVATLPASADWDQATVDTPVVGAGVDRIAWGVSLYGNGTLVTDDYSTTAVGTVPPPPTGGPAAQGSWTVLGTELPIRAIHATLLKNGKVLLIAGSGNDLDRFNAGTFQASVWDPVSGTFATLPVPKDMFCAGHVTLPDGRVLIQGGTKSYPTTAGGADYGGLKDAWTFDPDTNTFTTVTDANEGHWYPTLTALGDGDVWMGGGLKEDTTGAVNTEHWDTRAGTWLGTGQVPQTWSYWGLYPHMFLLADGRLFYSGGHVFGNGLPGSGASIYDRQAATVADVPGLRSKDLRDQSASVLLPPAQDQKVMITGGGNINTNLPGIKQTDVIDLKRPTPSYVPGPDLPGDGKMYVNATILPDRTVLTTNGGKFNRDASANVMTAAVYDPSSGAWTPMAADPVGRNYHSSAVLLPDGRVAVFGSNPGDGTFELRISVYSPTYLHKGGRPVISGAPATVAHGQQFTFGVDSDTTVRWAQLVRPMSVTHQMDSNMRLVDLPVTVTDGVATVSVPANRNLLPPGPYLLNVTDSEGIPSTSEWVMVQ